MVPISWRGRRSGTSNLDLREMGSRYAFNDRKNLLHGRAAPDDIVKFITLA